MDLYEADTDGSSGIRALFDTASSILGKDVRSLLQADAEVLKRTDVSQVAITVASLAAVKALAKRGIKPIACAGFSLGEYPALATAGVVSEADVIKLVFERGRIMQEVADEIAASAGSIDGASAAAPGMAAVLGLAPEAVDAVIAALVKDGKIDGSSLFGANYNSPLQTVISGTAAALSAAEEAFKAAGARRVLRLKVAGPFHSPLMAKAGTAFSRVLESVSFADPKLPLFSNVTGARVSSGSEAKACAVAHISNPVRWTMEEAAIAALLSSGSVLTSPELVEVGPGKVLSGLWTDSKHAGVCKPYTEILGA
jgi:[acyl-carrier-protein] S-malonyltransferase